MFSYIPWVEARNLNDIQNFYNAMINTNKRHGVNIRGILEYNVSKRDLLKIVENVATVDFNDMQTYAKWVAEWKRFYKGLSYAIREYSKTQKKYSRAVNKGLSYKINGAPVVIGDYEYGYIINPNVKVELAKLAKVMCSLRKIMKLSYKYHVIRG